MNPQLLARLRKDATSRVQVLEKRYAHATESTQVTVAREWRDALAADPPDVQTLAALARRSEELKYGKGGEIAFFWFCLEMKAWYHEMWADILGADPE